MQFKTFLYIYTFGGLTLIPLLLLSFFAFSYLVLPRVTPQSQQRDRKGSVNSASDSDSDTPLDYDAEDEGEAGNDAAGYFAVCREFVPGGINGKPPERSSPAGEVLSSESPNVYQSMYRSIFERNKTQQVTTDGDKKEAKPVKRPRNVFFVVLRHKHLLLFDNADQLEVRHVISLLHHDVDIYGGGEELSEGDLWIKRNCIRLTRRTLSSHAGPTSQPFYIFSDNCSEKEDFYHALLLAQSKGRDNDGPPLPRYINSDDTIKLVQALHKSDADIHCRWINALLGRTFLGVYKTSEMEDKIKAKIMKKISRVHKPNFISSIQVNNVDMGDGAPLFSNPRLKELMVDGAMTVETDVKYTGSVRLEIAAIARIELGSRIRAREVDLILAGVLRKLSGHLLIRIKPPPSNRIWISFETPPQMDFAVEPVVSSMQITYGVILRAIESRIKEVIVETLVLPNWDDMPFFDTAKSQVRGGIWDVPRKDPQDDVVDDAKSETVEVETASRKSEETIMEDEESDEDSGDFQHKVSKTLSMPSLINVPRKVSLHRKPKRKAVSIAEGTAVSSGISADLSTSSAVNRSPPKSPPKSPRALPADKPKALRSNSFAAAASPLVSIEDASPESPRPANLNNKKHRDVVEIFKEVKSRAESIPILKSDSDQGDKATAANSGSDAASSKHGQSSGLQESDADSASPTSIKTMPVLEPGKKSSTWSLSATPPAGSALERATNTAKNWGISMINRQGTVSRKSVSGFTSLAKEAGLEEPSTTPEDETQDGMETANADPSERQKQPIGRGQPLPPVGTPLPGPKQSLWSNSSLSLGSMKRKPVGGSTNSIGTEAMRSGSYNGSESPAQQSRRTSSADRSGAAPNIRTGSMSSTRGAHRGPRRSSTLDSLDDQREDVVVVAAPIEENDDHHKKVPPPLPARRTISTKEDHHAAPSNNDADATQSSDNAFSGAKAKSTRSERHGNHEEAGRAATDSQIINTEETQAGTIDTANDETSLPGHHRREEVRFRPRGGGWHTGASVGGNENGAG